MPSVRVALAVGLVLAAAAIAVVLSRSPLVVAGTNSVPANPAVGFVKRGNSGCQMIGNLPEGTSSIRISASANVGPKVRLRVLSGPLLITSGERDAGWGLAETVTVPVRRVSRTIPNANLCVAFGPAIESVQVNGELVPATKGGGVRLRVEYLRPGPASWWSLASSVARRMGLGHAPGGTWIVFLVMALMITVATLASRLVLREMG